MIFHKENFRRIREKSGMTLKEVADACGVSEATVQKWEKRPHFQPSPRRIPRIALLLGCRKEELATYGSGLSPQEVYELKTQLRQLEYKLIAGLETLLGDLKRYAEAQRMK